MSAHHRQSSIWSFYMNENIGGEDFQADSASVQLLEMARRDQLLIRGRDRHCTPVLFDVMSIHIQQIWC